MAGGANRGLRTAADANPARQRPRLDVGHHVLPDQRGARTPVPGDRSALHQLGEECGLLLEQLLVVREVVTEEGERLDAGAAAEDHLGAPNGDGVQGREALEDADRIVGAEYGDGGTEVYTRGPTRDRGQHDVGGRHGEFIGVVLADAEEVEADLLR